MATDMDARVAAMQARTAEIEAMTAAIGQGARIDTNRVAAVTREQADDYGRYAAEIKAGTVPPSAAYSAEGKRFIAAHQAFQAAREGRIGSSPSSASNRPRRVRISGTRRQKVVLVVFLILLGGCTTFVLIAGRSRKNTENDAACGRALDSYHAALVASDSGDGSGPNLSDAQEGQYQDNVVAACDEVGFQAFLKGPGYDYTKGPDAIAIGDPAAVYRAFCGDAPKPNHC